MNTYEIEQAFLEIEKLRDEIDTETGEFLYTEDEIQLKILDLEIIKEEKLDAIQNFREKNKADMGYYKNRADKANQKKKRAETLDSKLVSLEMLLLKGEKLKTKDFTYSIKTIDDYNYDDIDLNIIDKELVKTERKLDKTHIKEFVKAGGSIDGLKISEKTSLTVR